MENEPEKAKDLFDKSFKLYSLFWGLVLNPDEIKEKGSDITLLDEKGNQKASASTFDKFGSFIQKALDCCRE